MFPSKSRVFGILPASFQVPLRYWLSYVLGRLEPELFILKDLLRSGDLAIDIGANRGIYVYKLRLLGLRVHAFEPNSSCSDTLIRWGTSDPYLSVHTTALGDRIGTVLLQIPIDSQGCEHDSSSSIRTNAFDQYKSMDVPITTLDSFHLNDVSFIKIDVEGVEQAVLKGATSTLRMSWPALLIEIEKRHSAESFSTTFSFLQGKGYNCFFLNENSLSSFDHFVPEIHQRIDNFGISSRKYINNFLFLHSSHLERGTYTKFLQRWLDQ